MKSLEIFSGAGGLAKGLEIAGFEHSAFVEYNKHACASLAINFDRDKVYCGDIRNFGLDHLGTIDVVAGGPPCQPFSMGGKHKANQDDRDMFPYAIRTIEKLSPKAFVFENVKGLLRDSFADYFEYVLLRLTYPALTQPKEMDWQTHLRSLRAVNPRSYVGTRYDVQFKLLNAADYGVPQCRERVVIVGLRSDLHAKWTYPEATHSQDRLLWDIHVSGNYWERHGLPKPKQVDKASFIQGAAFRLNKQYGMFEPTLLPWQTVRDALKNVPDARDPHGIPDHIFRDGARVYPGHDGSDLDWPAKTIKAGGHGVPGGENMVRYPDGRVRYFTVYEAKLIQTFPPDFVITGAWGEALRQIGNAVPVKLGEAIGLRLVQTLTAAQATSKKAA